MRFRHSHLKHFNVIGLALLSLTCLMGQQCGAPPPSGNGNDGGGNGGIVAPIWRQTAELTAPDAAESDKFGAAVALDTETIVVGAPDKNGGNGVAYLYSRSSGWAFQSELGTPTDLDTNGQFAAAVAIDGDNLLIGAGNQGSTNPSSLLYLIGSVYVYQRSGTDWGLREELNGPADAQSQDYLGNAVAIDGGNAVAGAFGRNNLQGVAYVFSDIDDKWVPQDELFPDASGFNWFGWSVDISGDSILVGAYGQEAAYVFTGSGTNWTQQQRLASPQPAPLENFGSSVGISGDTAVIGASNFQSQTGQVYVFVRNNGTWSVQQTLVSPEPGGRLFGYSVGIDGDTIVVGAPKSSAAIVYVRSGATWTQQQRITPSGPEDLGQQFGISVAIRGNTIVVGAEVNQDAASNAGSAFVFERQ